MLADMVLYVVSKGVFVLDKQVDHPLILDKGLEVICFVDVVKCFAYIDVVDCFAYIDVVNCFACIDVDEYDKGVSRHQMVFRQYILKLLV